MADQVTHPMGPAKSGTTAEVVALKGPEIKQVIGLALVISGNELKVVGHRWPQGEPGKNHDLDNPPTADELREYINTLRMPTIVKPEPTPTLMDVQVRNTSLIFITSTIENFSFRSDVIATKLDKDGNALAWDDFFMEGSVHLLDSGQTVVWKSAYIRPEPLPDPSCDIPPKYYYDVLAQFSASSGDSRTGTLPIVIDPGTSNGGVEGWPT